MNPGT